MSERFSSVLKAFRVRLTAIGENLYPNPQTNADLSCDNSGNLWVREAIGPSSGSGASGTGWTFQAVPADDAAIIKAVPAILTQIGGFNDSAGSIYVQLFNRITVPVTAVTTPIMTWQVPSLASFSWTPSKGGRQFSTGISYGVSSTRDVYTTLATNIFLFAEGYIS